MRRVLQQYADSGIRTVDWESGYSQRLDTAVRRNIMDGLRQVKNETQRLIGKEIGSDGYEISAHMNPAPDHAPIQGRQYSFAEFEELNESLERKIGTLNCYHTLFAIILGISKPAHTEEELREMQRKSEELIDIDGKKYSRYQCTQLQRKLETKIRKLKDRRELFKAAGDEKGVRDCNRKIKLAREKYNRITKKAGLDPRYNRMNVVKSPEHIDNSIKKSIIEKAVKEGKINLTVNPEKQARHIKGSDGYIEGQSYLTVSEEQAQEIINTYSGTGKITYNKDGIPAKEKITCDNTVGIDVDKTTKAETQTNKATIHYSKTGTHLVPRKENENAKS